MEVVLSTKAQDDLDRLTRGNPKFKQNISAHLRRLPKVCRRDPFLKGIFRGYRKHRVGDYRIIYRADLDAVVLLVARVSVTERKSTTANTAPPALLPAEPGR